MTLNDAPTTSNRMDLQNLYEFGTNPDLLALLERAAKDPKLRKEVKTDPKGCIKDNGVSVPPGVQFEIMGLDVEVEGKLTGKAWVCKKVKRDNGEIEVCGYVTITVNI
jgi:hypothetical protein